MLDAGWTVLISESANILKDVVERGAIAWLWDPARARIMWATDAGVVFWHETSLMDLLERVFGPDDPGRKEMSRTLTGTDWEESHRRLKFIPENQAIWTLCHLRRLKIEGRLCILVEVDQIEDTPAEDPTSSDISLAQEAPIALALYNVDGALIRENDLCQRLFATSKSTSLMDRFGDKLEASKFILRSLADGAFSRSLAVDTVHGKRIHLFSAKRLAHPAQGMPAIALSIQDVHDSRSVWQSQQSPLPKAAVPSRSTKTVQVEKSMADAAQNQEETLKQFLDSVPDPVFTLSESGSITDLNEAAKIYIGERLKVSDPIDAMNLLIGSDVTDLFSSPIQKEITLALKAGQKGARDPFAIQNLSGEFSETSGLKGAIAVSLGSVTHGTEITYYIVLHDLSDQQEIQTSLIRAHDRAQQRDQQKLEFLAKVSHDMRTPLNAILGFTEIMDKEQLGPIENHKYKEYIGDIHNSSHFLLSLVNDLLDFAKIQSGKKTLEMTEVDIGETVRSTAHLLALQAQKSNISLNLDLSENLPSVVADARSMHRILQNILSNAIKHTQSGDEVSIKTSVNNEGALVLEVLDTGPGMSADDLKRSLEPFEQAKTKSKSGENIPSTGLGLPLAKALTEANKAEFEITSTLGKGTQIRITFPSTQVLV